MPGLTERVYPKEIRSSRVLENLMKEVHLRRYRLARDWLAAHLEGRPARVADIACGCGYGSEILASLGEVVGADIDGESIEYARRTYATERVSFFVGDLDDPAFLASLGSFDAVVTSGTVEHVADADAFLSWVRRALRPGGACVTCFPSTFTRDWASVQHRRDLSTRAAARLFSRCGFRVERQYHEGHRISMKDIRAEVRANASFPVPPLRKWVWYYLRRPHHLAARLYQMSPLGKGILFADQEYLLLPELSPA